MSKNAKLNFHETFNPDFEYISKILQIANDCDGLDKFEISEVTGIPTGKSSGKVEPHIEYAQFMNLIEYKKEEKKYYIKLTALGNLILNEDPYFLEDISKLISHYFLTSREFGATMWYKITRELQDKYGSEVKEEFVEKDLYNEYKIKINLSAFRSCYKSEKSLGNINLISIDDEIIKFNKNQYDEDYLYVYAYTLLKELEQTSKNNNLNRNEFTIDEVYSDISWQKGFLWDEDFAMNILEKLNDKNIIKLNRQLNPITIIANTNSESIIDDIYSLLI